MNWTVFGSIIGIAVIASATFIKIVGTGRRQYCMSKFEEIVKKQALTEQKFETIEQQLSDIKSKQDKIEEKIDKLMFLLPKREENHRG
jgi:septal ring factor EnvC (AmiA/AmiB activator)